VRAYGKFAVLLLGIAALSACSGITTSSDYDKGTNFSKYKTYAWKDVHPTQNALVENRIKSAVDSVLASKGLKKVDASPDLWVVEHTHLTKETQVDTYNTGWGYGWRWGYGAGMTTSTVSQIPVGNLVVDLVDAGEKQLVWRGTASKALDSSATAADREKSTNEAVQKMFAGYPPGK
jgi:hypothetical protein